MKIYVVTLGSSVVMATGSREQAENFALDKAGQSDSPERTEIRRITEQTWEAYYMASRTHRWNRSNYLITELEAGVPRW